MSSPTVELLRLLSRPGPPVTVQKVDFKSTDLPENEDLHAVILDNVLSAKECQQLVAAAEASTNGLWEQAMVSVGNYQQELRTDVRDCGRIIWDDQEVAGMILQRIESFVPEIKSLRDVPLITGKGPMKRKETWQLYRPNERLRVLKYGPGQFFRVHCDGTYQTPDKSEMSFYTLHLYLNESDPSDPTGELKGGSTVFHSGDMKREYKVEPRIGRVLIFQHRFLWHSGEEVITGTKLTLRTDLMYKKASIGYEAS